MNVGQSLFFFMFMLFVWKYLICLNVSKNTQQQKTKNKTTAKQLQQCVWFWFKIKKFVLKFCNILPDHVLAILVYYYVFQLKFFIKQNKKKKKKTGWPTNCSLDKRKMFALRLFAFFVRLESYTKRTLMSV